MADGVAIATLVFVGLQMLIWIALIVGAVLFVPKLVKKAKDTVNNVNDSADQVDTTVNGTANSHGHS